MAQKLASVSSKVHTTYVELITEGRPLDALAIAAERRHQEDTDIGLPETREALKAVYKLTHFLATLSEDEIRGLVSDPTLQPPGSPSPFNPSLKADKRRFSNPALLAALCIMAARDKGTRSKAATVCSAALEQKKQPNEFDDWLLGEHRSQGTEGGALVGAGFTNAYNAYRNTRQKTGNRVAAASLQAAENTAVSAEEFDNILQEIFKLALTTRDLIVAPDELSFNGIFGLWVRPNGSGISDYAIQMKSRHVIEKELIADREQRTLFPVNTATNAIEQSNGCKVVKEDVMSDSVSKKSRSGMGD